MGRNLVSYCHFLDQGHSNIDVSELEVEALLVVLHVPILVDGNRRVRPNNVLNILINEVVERVDMLLDEASNSQKRRHQLPLILHHRQSERR